MRCWLLTAAGKAIEALFIAAYLAQRWGTRLSVLTVNENPTRAEETQRKAHIYLQQQNVNADYELRKGAAGEALLYYAAEQDSDFILMGGYGAVPLVEMVIGSTLDYVLREFKGPVLVCR